MSHEASEGWVERRIRAAMKGEIDALRAGLTELTEAAQAGRAEIEATRAEIAEIRSGTAELRTVVHNIEIEIGNIAARAEEGLNALRAAMEGDGRIEALRAEIAGDQRIETLRLRVEGLLAQHRWDTDQLRQAVTALAERIPLDD